MSQTYYVIESSGDARRVWGPYPTLAAASKSAGKRHVVVTGDGLRGGDVMSRGAVKAAVQSGRVRPADGTDPDVRDLLWSLFQRWKGGTTEPTPQPPAPPPEPAS